MKKIMFFVILTFSLATGFVYSKTINVKPGDNIQSAVNKATSGDTIILKSGAHIIKTNLEIKSKSNLSIKGEKGAKIICDNTDSPVISIYSSKDINISNIFATHKEPEKVQYACAGSVIEISECSGIINITNCDLNGCGTIGVAVYSANIVNIKDCFIHNNSDSGVTGYEAKQISVENSILVNNNGKPFVEEGKTKINKKNNIIKN
ncbi:MAG: right-handed parallel beta-helix repeat-containing protein [Spirochaetota bacterium]|nr:right-handed parallel beta-helix repeat-containing protein [Spirochaetota bacterium]